MMMKSAAVESPRTGEMREILQRQRDAFLAELPVSAAARKDRLRRASDLLVTHKDRLATALSNDFGHRSHTMSLMMDIMGTVKAYKHALKNIDNWMKPEKRKLDFPLGLLGAKAHVEYQPKGVVGIIGPWNFPIHLTFSPLVQVFAAGNRAMVKPSEFTPETSALMADLAQKSFDPSELSFITGGPDVGKAFAGLPFDHLIFTGGTAIAKHILHAAAEHLVPTTLELGGKSPVIISAGADVALTAERIILGKVMNAGQICLAPDYLLVPQSKEDEIAAALEAAARRLYPSVLSNPDYTSVVNDRHRARLQSLLDDAREQGARVTIVNPANEDLAAAGNKMPLHLVRDVRDSMRITQEEIFGPLLPIIPYSRIHEAVDYINRRDRPLAVYYFGHDRAEERHVLDRTISGGVTINDVLFHAAAEDLPFGGIGPSGMGSYHGHDGFKTFSHAKAVYKQPKLDLAGLAGFKPPYGEKIAKTLKREIG